MDGDQSDAPAAAAVASAWDIGDVTAAEAPDAGTVNQTVLLTTGRGRFVLRGYRHRDRAPVEREHAVIPQVRAQGLPAVAPLPLPAGGTMYERGGHFYALFPWATGRQVPRAALGWREAAAMGAFLARLHLALGDFPTDQVPIPRRSQAFTRRATLARIDELMDLVRAGAAADPLAPTVLTRLGGQRAHVARLPAAGEVDFGGLPEQVVHGDYQESNLFFADRDDVSEFVGGSADGSAISAIIDWDQTHLAPRAREVMRTLKLVFGLEPTRCWHFLRAYRAEGPLPLEELDTAAAAFDVLTSHGLRVYEAPTHARQQHGGAAGVHAAHLSLGKLGLVQHRRPVRWLVLERGAVDAHPVAVGQLTAEPGAEQEQQEAGAGERNAGGALAAGAGGQRGAVDTGDAHVEQPVDDAHPPRPAV